MPDYTPRFEPYLFDSLFSVVQLLVMMFAFELFSSYLKLKVWICPKLSIWYHIICSCDIYIVIIF